MDKLSAWMDGELDEALAAAEFQRARNDSAVRERWDTFHMIGDAMRGDQLLSQRFAERFSERLAEEPTVLAPQRRAMSNVARYALSAAASVAAVAVVAWIALSGTGPADQPGATPAMIARTPVAPLQVPATVVNVPDNGRMHEYLLAHMGVSPSTALQGLAPYIHTVTVQQAEGR